MVARLRRSCRRYARGVIERDHVRFLGGVRGGETRGSPVAMLIENLDHAAWQGRMRAEPFDALPEPLTRPRPGHAIEGVEIGLGFEAARRRGSEVHDAIGWEPECRRFVRPTNRAGDGGHRPGRSAPGEAGGRLDGRAAAPPRWPARQAGGLPT
jgi:chorismate synthase